MSHLLTISTLFVTVGTVGLPASWSLSRCRRAINATVFIVLNVPEKCASDRESVLHDSILSIRGGGKGGVSESTPYVGGAGKGVPARTPYMAICGRARRRLPEAVFHFGILSSRSPSIDIIYSVVSFRHSLANFAGCVTLSAWRHFKQLQKPKLKESCTLLALPKQ